MTDSSAGGNLTQNEVGDLFRLIDIVSEAWVGRCILENVIQLG